MTPKRVAPDTDADTDTGDTLMPPPPPPPTTPSSNRRRTSCHTRTPNTTAPPSLFFEVPLPPLYDPSSPLDATNQPPSDSQFAGFLHSAIPTLPAPTQALYASAMRNLAPDNTPELTGEMRASLTSAVTGFVAHLPTTTDWEGRFLTRLARGEVSARELVLWADTTTAALRAFSAAGGSPAPSWPSSPMSAGSPIPAQSPDPATPTPRATAAATAPAHPRYSSRSGRSATIRTSALTRDNNACVLTSLGVSAALEVAHIVPFSVRGTKADTFWAFLGLFLGVQGAERVRWATLRLANGEEQRQPGALASAAAVGELANCITLAATAHRYFDAGMIEMLPMPGSGAWSGDYEPSVVSSYDVRLSFPGQALTPFSRYVYSDGTPPQLLSSTQLAPGDIVTLTTPDPAQWPLPHPLLLQLHALCGRVKRLRAAAGWPVLPNGDGSENEVGWGEEEVEVWDEDEDEGTKARWEEQFEGAARAEPEPERESGMVGRRGSGKRKYGAAVGEEQEEMLEWPRKVAVVMGEMGMREEERWRLMKGSSARGR
ncbi:hypothetical protein DFP73DRAFT_560865 [Morchella snyderi]|nr:hypothetical protein DFP73DRAFT_560865 [Morchella snyderi]